MRIKPQKFFFILLISIFLHGCSIFSSSQDLNPLVNKELTLDAPRLLVQTQYISWVSWSEEINIYTIEHPGNQNTCLERAQHCLPTISSFLQNPAPWQAWHKDSTGAKYRVVGVLPKGTQFHFYKIDVPDNINTGVIIFYSIIDSGQYKNLHAYYKYDEASSYDLHMIHILLPLRT